MIKNEVSATPLSKASFRQGSSNGILLSKVVAPNFLESESLETLKTQ